LSVSKYGLETVDEIYRDTKKIADPECASLVARMEYLTIGATPCYGKAVKAL